MSPTQPSSSPTIDQSHEATSSGVDENRNTPVQLDGSIDWPSLALEVARYWYIPALAVSYGVHRLVRRYVPRRSAPWTSLRLSELYLTGGLAQWFIMRSLADMVRAYKDHDVAVVAIAGPRIQSASARRFLLCDDAVQEPRVREIVRAIRYPSYGSNGLRGKLLWWHYHIWADKASYDAVAKTIVYRSLQADPTWTPRHLADYDICTSHIALYVSKRSTYISNSIWGAFATSIPLGLYLRRSGRRTLPLPTSIVQRVLIGLVLYSDIAYGCHSLNRLPDIQDRRQVATAATRVFGNLDEEIAEARETFEDFRFLFDD